MGRSSHLLLLRPEPGRGHPSHPLPPVQIEGGAKATRLLGGNAGHGTAVPRLGRRIATLCAMDRIACFARIAQAVAIILAAVGLVVLLGPWPTAEFYTVTKPADDDRAVCVTAYLKKGWITMAYGLECSRVKDYDPVPEA